MYRKRRRWPWVLSGILILAAALGGLGYYLWSHYTVTEVYVEGNLHYTQEEIRDIVMEGPLGNNSLYLSLKYRNKGVENIPFVDVMDVSIVSPNAIRITVYEKALAGYVAFMDSLMYFDKDGYVVESSSVRTAGIPQITGLSFDHIVLGEKLPVEDDSVFESIMDITKLLSKYELTADKIYFQAADNIVLYFGGVKAALGDRSGLEEKIMVLPQFLKELGDRKGTIRMENYESGGAMTVFEAQEESGSDE